MEENVDSAIQGAGWCFRWRKGVIYVPRDYGRAFETAEGSTLRAEGRHNSLLCRGDAVAPARGDYGDSAPAATWEDHGQHPMPHHKDGQ